MKIAIHHSPNSFSERWIEYCTVNKINYKLVDCYDNNIINAISDCSALMWHLHHASPKDVLFAKQLIYSVEASGKTVFPNFNSVWHFDDKIGQKYLLESLNLPVVESYVFYDKVSANNWAVKSEHPLVFKLRGGAGSVNVKLSKDLNNTNRLIKQAFTRGFKHSSLIPFSEILKKFIANKTSFLEVIKSFVRLVIPSQFSKINGKEKGYIYFQKFIADNDSDIRVIVINEKAFAIKRMVRKNDFRASGSGEILYGKELFDVNIISTSFHTASKLKTQCLALDFVLDKNKKPQIVEISYGFAINGYDPCPGYWDEQLNWHEGKFNPYGWMVDLVIKKANET